MSADDSIIGGASDHLGHRLLADAQPPGMGRQPVPVGGNGRGHGDFQQHRHGHKQLETEVTTIYVVTQGDYSDYHIEAMFSTRDLADLYIERRKEHYGGGYDGGVEEYELDSINDAWLAGKVKWWNVCLERDTADVVSAELAIGSTPSEGDVAILGPKWFRTFVFADTQERAVKVAMERRSIWLANGMQQ